MSVLAGQGGRGLRDRVTYGGTSPCESSYSRARAGRLLTASARCPRVACRPHQLDTLEAVEEGRADLVVAKLARADDELAGRVGDGVAELHVVDRGSWRLDDDRRSSWTIDLSYFSPRPLRRIPGTAARFSHSARALFTRFLLSFTFRLFASVLPAAS